MSEYYKGYTQNSLPDLFYKTLNIGNLKQDIQYRNCLVGKLQKHNLMWDQGLRIDEEFKCISP